MERDERLTQAVRMTLLGILINVVLIVLKVVAGIVSKSTAIIADAFHSGTDLFTDLGVIAGFKLASRPADDTHKYGHGKFETMTAFILGIVLALTGLWIGGVGVVRVWQALHGLPLPRPGIAAVAAALLSILFKELIYRLTVATGSRLKSDALLANALHHRSDALSSMAVMAGIIGAMVLGENLRLLDPAAAVLVSFFILKLSLGIIGRSGSVLLDRSLEEPVEKEILRLVSGVDGIHNPHSLRTRRMGNNIVVDLHIEVDADLSVHRAHEIGNQVEAVLKDTYGADTLVFVHIDPLEVRP